MFRDIENNCSGENELSPCSISKSKKSPAQLKYQPLLQKAFRDITGRDLELNVEWVNCNLLEKPFAHFMQYENEICFSHKHFLIYSTSHEEVMRIYNAEKAAIQGAKHRYPIRTEIEVPYNVEATNIGFFIVYTNFVSTEIKFPVCDNDDDIVHYLKEGLIELFYKLRRDKHKTSFPT